MKIRVYNHLTGVQVECADTNEVIATTGLRLPTIRKLLAGAGSTMSEYTLKGDDDDLPFKRRCIEVYNFRNARIQYFVVKAKAARYCTLDIPYFNRLLKNHPEGFTDGLFVARYHSAGGTSWNAIRSNAFNITDW